jgi:hypothetical protein
MLKSNTFIRKISLIALALFFLPLHAAGAGEDAEAKAAACSKMDVGQLVAMVSSMPREHLRQSTQDSLSVPRLPVMNPCM